MNTVAHPAARPASTSLLRSPTMKLFFRLMPSSTAASRIMPGLGLRQSQCSPWPWKQALTASRGNSRAMISCIASTSEWAIKPSPTSGWLVTTAKRKPACLSFWRLAAASGYSLKSSSRLGAKLRPSRNSGTTITPSRSRNTAGLNPWARLTISSAYAARLDGLGQGGDPVRIDLGDQDDHVAVLGGISAVPAYDPEHLCRTRLGEIDRLDDVGADVALGVAAADRIDQNCILVAEMTGVEPCCKDRIPPLVIGACGELRDVVNRAVGFDPAELAKVIDGVAAIGGAAADTDQEQPAFAVPQLVELGRQGLDRSK